MKPSTPALCEAKPSQRKGSQVLRVTIFRRRGSRYWQARVWIKGKLVRITTRTQNRQAAEDFAVLAWRHFARGGGHTLFTISQHGAAAAVQQSIGI